MERSLSRTSSTRTSNWSAKADHSTRMDIGHANEKHFVSVLRQTTFQNVVDHPSAYSYKTHIARPPYSESRSSNTCPSPVHNTVPASTPAASSSISVYCTSHKPSPSGTVPLRLHPPSRYDPPVHAPQNPPHSPNPQLPMSASTSDPSTAHLRPPPRPAIAPNQANLNQTSSPKTLHHTGMNMSRTLYPTPDLTQSQTPDRNPNIYSYSCFLSHLSKHRS
ncbi:predicted protein [Plenodomus lingam JN3]|uniref:Predicted protein n=1 Tax=Leptosphaeria maculans (strain JN3 / isolate v23.1.3 / race Av1-4-5-6-7-8) TaxID=985895 RepID=E5R4P9_LEPMJ|nr:predicted protein [Plenodomus lingam JN3]CBX92172.1 predicted protein [Plenodomus lingam JN3]